MKYRCKKGIYNLFEEYLTKFFLKGISERNVAMTEIELLRKENERLIAENTYLKKLLDNNGISYEYTPKQAEIVDTASEINRRIKLFMKLFCARTEFYAERWENKEGRSGYAPACGNRWTFVCPKKKDKSVKCYECENNAWIPLTEDVAYKHKEDILKPLTLTLADCIYIPKDTVKPRTMNRIRKIATFSNPQFYKMQAMRYSTKQIPRYIQCFRDFDKFVALPRGCLPTLEEKLQEAGISYKVEDCRNCGRVITVSFQGSLQPEQEKAAITMLEHEIGILGVVTGFEKPYWEHI